MLRPIATLAVLFAAGIGPRSMWAQSAPTAAPSACTYETCALRVEPRFFGSSRLLRGRAGEPVGSLSAFGGGVDSLLAGPDSAAILARRYVNDTKRASVLGLFGTAAYVVLLVHSDNFRNDIDAVSGTAAVASVGFALATIPFTLRSLRNLSRAVWHYNAALAAR